MKEKVYGGLIENSVYRYECSECGFSDEHNSSIEVPFCWHCGARMEAAQEWRVNDMADLIEKNAVFELIRSFPNVDRQLPIEFMKALYELPTIITAEDDAIENLPSAQKTGTWIDYQKGKWIYAQCNKCGTVWDVKSNYCPHCGAKMEDEQDGDD